MAVQEHDQRHRRSIWITLSICQDLRNIEHLKSANNGCDQCICQNWTDQRQCNIEESLDTVTSIQVRCLEDILTKDVDGLIIEPSKSQILCRNMPLYEQLDRMGIPYVFIQGSYLQMKNKPTILLDDAKGAYLLTKYLIDTGHRQIAGVFKADDSQGAERHKGYVKALQEAGMSYQPELVVWFHTEDRKVKPAVMVQMMLEAGLPIDAVVCYNDQIAVEVIRMLERIGKKVPEDLSVTGYDDSMIARTGPVELTTVSHPQEKLGEMAAELLLELLHGIPPEESRVLRLIEPELVIRKSCMERR